MSTYRLALHSVAPEALGHCQTQRTAVSESFSVLHVNVPRFAIGLFAEHDTSCEAPRCVLLLFLFERFLVSYSASFMCVFGRIKCVSPPRQSWFALVGPVLLLLRLWQLFGAPGTLVNI